MSTTPRTDNAWRRYNCADLPDPQELAKEMIALETELAAAKAECYLNRTRIASLFWSGVLDKYTGNDVQKLAADYTAELARLRADNIVAHQMACAAGLERDQLRAEVSEARRAWLGDDYGHLPLIEALEKFRSDSDAQSDRADVLYQRSCEVEHALRAEVERLDAEKPWLKEANARAAHAEAALAKWSVLNLWGGTPEIIHEFIKGQQNRIHHCQDLETELAHLRADLERFTGHGLLDCHTICDQRDAAIARAERAEAALTEAIDGVIDGGSIPDTLLVIHIPRSPVGYRVGQPVKVILPAIDAAMKGTT